MKLRLGIRAALAAMLLAGPSLALAAPPPPPLEAYGDLPGIEDMSISPSGRSLVIASRVAGERHLIVLDGERKLRASAPLSDLKLRSIHWAGEDMVLMITSATTPLGFGFTTDKVELFGAAVIHLNGGKSQMVFSRSQSIANAIFGTYGVRLIDGRWVGYFGGIEYARTADRTQYAFDHGRPALFAVDLERNEARKIARAPAEGHRRDWLVDGKGAAAATLDINEVKGTWQILNEQGVTIASGVDPTGDIGLISFGSDGNSVIYSYEDDAGEQTRWLEVPLAGGTPKEVLADASIEHIYVDQRNGRMLSYLEREASPKPVLFDPAMQATANKVFAAFPGRERSLAEWTPDFGHLLVRTSGNSDSGTWFSVDVVTRKADPIGDERPLVGPDQVGPISTVSYRAADGLELDGVLTLPPGREPKGLPVVVLPHGGPHYHDEPVFDWWAQAFASRGYAVFQPNFRGSTNRDVAFRRAGYGQWGRKMQTDISDGLAELAKRGLGGPAAGLHHGR